MAGLSPMSRLLILAGLTSVGTSNVRFVDADRASLSFGSSPTAMVDGEGSDGSPRTQQPRQQQGSGSLNAARRPRSGQLGLLEFDPQGRGSEFVVSTDVPLPERLTITADDVFTTRTPLSGEDSIGRSSGGNPEGLALTEGENEDEGGRNKGGPTTRVGVVIRGSDGRGGGGSGDVSYSSTDGAGATQDREPVCVRYLSTIGASAVQRVDWFPTPEDAHSLRSAIDTYCPIPFLRGQEEDGGGGGVRRLLLYQRDQNRQIRNPKKVRQAIVVNISQRRAGAGSTMSYLAKRGT